MGKSIYTLEVEVHSEEIPGVMFAGKPAKSPTRVSRILKVNNEIVFQKDESFEDYCTEKSIMKNFISSLTPLGIKELKNGNCPNAIL